MAATRGLGKIRIYVELTGDYFKLYYTYVPVMRPMPAIQIEGLMRDIEDGSYAIVGHTCLCRHM